MKIKYSLQKQGNNWWIIQKEPDEKPFAIGPYSTKTEALDILKGLKRSDKEEDVPPESHEHVHLRIWDKRKYWTTD